jgi:hypothetical protein
VDVFSVFFAPWLSDGGCLLLDVRETHGVFFNNPRTPVMGWARMREEDTEGF